MAEVDTSSYPKPQAPTNILDTAGKWQGLEQGNVNLQQSKLKQINDQFQIMNAELATLANDPNATKEQAQTRLLTLAKTFNFKPEITNHMMGELQAAPTVQAFAQNALVRGMQTQEKVNNLYGPISLQTNNQQGQYVQGSPLRGVKPIGAPFQLQVPPTAETTDNQPMLPNGEPNPNYGSRGLVGPRLPIAPPGVATQPGGPAAPSPRVQTLPVGPNNDPRIPGESSNFGGNVTGVTVEPPTPNQTVNNRFPTSLAPGVSEAASQAGTASGVQLASERTKAANFQRDIFPLAQAIPALEKLGTKGTGPGTETINHLKSFVLSNIPGVKESDFGFGTVKDFDKAKKYLTDFVNQTGSSGTNDKLAAAFAGNPSVGISNAAAVDVAKSALALRRMQQSRYLAFEDSGLTPDQASKFFANGLIKYQIHDASGKVMDRSIRLSQLDPRAFGVDMMDDKAKKKLLDQLNKNPREKELFDRSLEIAIKHGYLNPR